MQAIRGGKHVAQPGQRKAQALSEYVRFETQHRAVLLYELDKVKWIGSHIRHDNRTGELINLETWGTLNEGESDEYRRYIQRHKQCRDAGRRTGKGNRTQGGGGTTIVRGQAPMESSWSPQSGLSCSPDPL